MATLQSISKQVHEFDDVITREPINNDDTNDTKTTTTAAASEIPPNGIIQTKSRPHGVEGGSPNLEKEGSHGKDTNVLSSKTRKKLMAFKKRSLDVIQDADRKSSNTSPGSSEMGDYHFKRRVSHFVNMAFESNELETSNLKFFDVVRKVINNPIKEDIHPFGRGHLYASAFDGVEPKIHHEEGKYLIWILASLFIIGIAGSVIIMSITYTPEVVTFDPSTSSPITRLNTTT